MKEFIFGTKEAAPPPTSQAAEIPPPPITQDAALPVAKPPQADSHSLKGAYLL
jgi:hypothetical protein